MEAIPHVEVSLLETGTVCAPRSSCRLMLNNHQRSIQYVNICRCWLNYVWWFAGVYTQTTFPEDLHSELEGMEGSCQLI